MQPLVRTAARASMESQEVDNKKARCASVRGRPLGGEDGRLTAVGTRSGCRVMTQQNLDDHRQEESGRQCGGADLRQKVDVDYRSRLRFTHRRRAPERARASTPKIKVALPLETS